VLSPTSSSKTLWWWVVDQQGGYHTPSKRTHWTVCPMHQCRTQSCKRLLASPLTVCPPVSCNTGCCKVPFKLLGHITNNIFTCHGHLIITIRLFDQPFVDGSVVGNMLFVSCNRCEEGVKCHHVQRWVIDTHLEYTN